MARMGAPVTRRVLRPMPAKNLFFVAVLLCLAAGARADLAACEATCSGTYADACKEGCQWFLGTGAVWDGFCGVNCSSCVSSTCSSITYSQCTDYCVNDYYHDNYHDGRLRPLPRQHFWKMVLKMKMFLYPVRCARTAATMQTLGL